MSNLGSKPDAVWDLTATEKHLAPILFAVQHLEIMNHWAASLRAIDRYLVEFEQMAMSPTLGWQLKLSARCQPI
jgi:hypothetical protein